MRKILLFATLALAPGIGSACTYLAPFQMDQMTAADLVVVGEVTGYLDLGTPAGAALVTVALEDTLKGVASGEVVFIWNGGMAQGPHKARATGRVLIGAMRGGRIAVSDIIPDARPDLPSIVQPFCGEVWMLPATSEAVGEARKVLE